MPGRRRTGSRPSSTSMSLAVELLEPEEGPSNRSGSCFGMGGARACLVNETAKIGAESGLNCSVLLFLNQKKRGKSCDPREANTSVIIKSPAAIMGRKSKIRFVGRVHFTLHYRGTGERAARPQGAAYAGRDRCPQYTHHLAGLGAGLRHSLFDRPVRPCELSPHRLFAAGGDRGDGSERPDGDRLPVLRRERK